MGGSIAWGGVLTSGIIGVGVDYMINKGLDKMGVENQWVKLGASVIGGLMVGGGLMALKKKLGSKVAKVDTFAAKKVELMQVDRSTTDLVKKNNNFVTGTIDRIKDHQKTAKDVTEKLTEKNSDVLDMRAVESLFGENLKAVQQLIRNEMEHRGY